MGRRASERSQVLEDEERSSKDDVSNSWVGYRRNSSGDMCTSTNSGSLACMSDPTLERTYDPPSEVMFAYPLRF